MLVISHRGLTRSHPENTLGAFHDAAALGVGGIETDVRRSRDGVAVLIHDRVLPDGSLVTDRTRREIESIVGHDVPTLGEALDEIDVPLWNVEIKTIDGAEAARPILEACAQRREILVTSFRHDVVASFRGVSGLRLGILMASRPATREAAAALLAPFGDRVSHVVWSWDIFDETLDLSLETFVYGVQTEGEHEQSRALGLDGVITDHPRMLLSV